MSIFNDPVRRTNLLTCIGAAVSAAGAVTMYKTLMQHDVPRMLQQMPVALGIGLVLGIGYYLLMSRVIPRLDRHHADELWAGLKWFNLSILAFWTVLLPLDGPKVDFLMGLSFAAGCARLVGSVYTVFGASLSNRKRFANTFVMLTVTTMMVITVVKASLALSLGLVGALSIIRFRTAIKESEELAFLFFTIAIGLGFGAEKFAITLCAFWAVCVGYILFHKVNQSSRMENAYLVTLYGAGENLLQRVGEFMKQRDLVYEITRLEAGEESTHVSVMVEIPDESACELLGTELQGAFSGMGVTIVQARSLF